MNCACLKPFPCDHVVRWSPMCKWLRLVLLWWIPPLFRFTRLHACPIYEWFCEFLLGFRWRLMMLPLSCEDVNVFPGLRLMFVILRVDGEWWTGSQLAASSTVSFSFFLYHLVCFFCLFFCRDSVFDTDKKLMGAVSQVRTSRPGVTLLSVVGVLACSHLGWCFLGKRVFASFFWFIDSSFIHLVFPIQMY